MNIDILYTEDDAGWSMVLEMVEHALDELNLDADIEARIVQSDRQAHEIGFVGSPTIRVDGEDLFPVHGASAGLRLRSYWTDQGLLDMPTYPMIVDALRAFAGS
jgi:hypothetical protein